LVIYKPIDPDSAAAEPESAKTRRSASTGSRGSKASHRTQTAKYHKVKKGETLSGIAASNHMSVSELKHENPDLDATLEAGEVLRISK
jgi:LysM repeat protein